MLNVESTDLTLLTVALVAAMVNGALGYGFSSITVPVALLWHTNRVLNPALVLVELLLSGMALVANRKSLRKVAWPMRHMLIGAVPGVLLGSYALFVTTPDHLKFMTYGVLLPLIIIQSAGMRWPMRSDSVMGLPLGAGVGALYAATTISGPPLALLFNNQGLSKDEFRAALSLFRLVETTLTALVYWKLGLFTSASVALSLKFAPVVAVGLPLGYLLLRAVQPETFRRACMVADALLVSYGLARVSVALQLTDWTVGYGAIAIVAGIELVIILQYLKHRQRAALARAAGDPFSRGDYDQHGGALERRDFPIAMQLHGRRILMVGGGNVAEGRVQQLLDVGAVVHLVSPEVTAGLQIFAEHHQIEWARREYSKGDCAGARLVFAASDDKRVNAAVIAEARGLNILANAADEPELCDFYMPSIGREGSITVAVSTAGVAPGLSRHLRQRAMGIIGPEYAKLARLLSRLRRVLPAGPARMRALRMLVDEGAVELLARRDRAALHLLIRRTCGPLLKPEQARFEAAEPVLKGAAS